MDVVVGVLAALPAAQNINTYAAVYRRGEALAWNPELAEQITRTLGGGIPRSGTRASGASQTSETTKDSRRHRYGFASGAGR